MTGSTDVWMSTEQFDYISGVSGAGGTTHFTACVPAACVCAGTVRDVRRRKQRARRFKHSTQAVTARSLNTLVQTS